MKHTPQSGFSLIELIVSLGVFAVVVTTSIGALLMLVAANEDLQEEQNIMTNLSFALDSMTREIRTGTSYHCASYPSYSFNGSGNMFADGNSLDDAVATPQDCVNGSSARLHGLSFIESGNSVSGVTNDRIAYFFDEDTRQFYRRIGTGAPEPIISSGIYIHEADVIVSGSDRLLDGDTEQPTVTILIVASEDENTPAEEQFRIQTTITQRTLDI